MGLATIDPHGQKDHTEIHKIPKFGVLTEIQAFKNVKHLQRNVWKTGQIRTNVRICPVFHTFLCKCFTFLNACISVKTSLINMIGDFVNLSEVFLTMWRFPAEQWRFPAEQWRFPAE